MFYYLFSEGPKLLGSNSQSWVDVEMTDGSRLVGGVHQYGLLYCPRVKFCVFLSVDSDVALSQGR